MATTSGSAGGALGDGVPTAEALLAEARALLGLRRGQSLPDDAVGLACLGTVHRLQGRYAEASELYRRALALDPEQLQARLGAALLLYLQGNDRRGRRSA